MDKKEIREAVEDVFKNIKPLETERKMKLVSYCKGVNGAKEYSGSFFNLCSHPECNNCRKFESMFKEEVDKQLKELGNE